MSTQDPAAATVKCEGCGTETEVQSPQGTFTCSFCGHTQALRPTLKRQLGSYERAINSYGQRADTAAEGAHQWQDYTERPHHNAGWIIALSFAIPTVAGLVVWGGMSLGLSQNAAGALSMVAMAACVVAAILWYRRREMQGKQRAARDFVPIKSTCPACGAIHCFEVGQVVEFCSHCDAALVPSAGVIQEGVNQSFDALRQARMNHQRARRAWHLQQAPTTEAEGLTTATILVLVVICGATLLFTSLMMVGIVLWDSSILWGWGLSLVVISGSYLMHRDGIKLQKMRVPIERSLLQLAVACDGEFIQGLEGAMGWLNHFWPGDTPAAGQWHESSMHCAVSFQSDGYEALLDLDLNLNTEPKKPVPLLLIHVACDLPGLTGTVEDRAPGPRQTPESQALRAQILQEGFHLEYSESGLMFRAGSAAAARLLAGDQSHMDLAPTLALVGQLARALGAGAVRPLPVNPS